MDEKRLMSQMIDDLYDIYLLLKNQKNLKRSVNNLGQLINFYKKKSKVSPSLRESLPGRE